MRKRDSTWHTARVLVLLIHGAYTSPWHWHRLVPHLEEAGCEVVVPELPVDDPEAGIERYVATVESALEGRTEPPLVVGSSLGGVTACVFAARHPVRALVTVNAVVPWPRRAITADMADLPQPEFLQSIDYNPDGSTTFRPEAAVELVFHESEPEIAHEAAARLRRQAGLPFTEPCPFDALPDVPRMGVTSGEDRLLRPEWLERAIRERLGIEPRLLPGDHTPMLSKPDRLAELLLEAANDTPS
jgi:pimeloyl-ACP methyl ester carboxylesterase